MTSVPSDRSTGTGELIPRVAILARSFEIGGTSVAAILLAGELHRRGIPCRVIHFDEETPYLDDFRRLEIDVRVWDYRHYLYEDRMKAALEALAEFRPTAVIANHGGDAMELLRHLPQGILRIGMVHIDSEGVYDGLLAPYAEWLDLLAAVSEQTLATVRTHPRLKAIEAQYVPCGVAMPETMPQRSGEGALRLLYFGRLGEMQKRVKLFPQILAQLVESGEAVEWTLIGEGPEEEWLKERMSSEGKVKVIFRGTIPYRDVPAELARHDVMLLASAYEGLPLSLLEAMAAGMVPVVSDIPSGVRQVVDGSTGFLVPPEKIEGYGEAILQLARDRGEWREKSQRARQRVLEGFSIQALGERWLREVLIPRGRKEPLDWNRPLKVQPPLGWDGRFLFSPVGRWLRRVAKR